MEEVDAAWETAYQRMLERAVRDSRGERKRRLLEKHGHLEQLFLSQVWWPAVGSLAFLQPEYEFVDLNGRTRFCDYAYLPSKGLRVAIEADGFGPHARDANRWQLDDDRERQNQMLIDGWKLLRFTSDGIKEKPGRCQRTLLLALAKWGRTTAAGDGSTALGVHERAILHFNQTFDGRMLTPRVVAEALNINPRTAIVHMRSLEEKGYLSAMLSPTGRKMGFVLAVPDLTRR
ncbi:winged helix-turn-helix domain-containing protein [Cohnella sp. REN36]|uniref:winged helix-turn-helix domain-containing protein n=1 Tax=Cohnella sp. REN36 TaxID=2887347 RepID=UPI001D14442E|nr:winged helix-turn-helix domain-containing protein [Cohnella sp. REN36]MCC3377574.1 winged helix-turn-helix domain-containing protein [Cohnella sp. REN36]